MRSTRLNEWLACVLDVPETGMTGGARAGAAGAESHAVTVVGFLRGPGPRAGREAWIVSPDGRRVASLPDGRVTSGVHRLIWSGRDDQGGRAGSGIYFLKVRMGALVEARKIVFLR